MIRYGAESEQRFVHLRSGKDRQIQTAQCIAIILNGVFF